MMKLLTLSTFFSFIFLAVDALQSCPRNQCIPLAQCPYLSSAVRSRDPRLLRLVRSAICGYIGHRSKVCCDVEVERQRVTPPTPAPTRRVCLKDQHGNEHCRHVDRNNRQEVASLLPEVCGKTGVTDRIYGGTNADFGASPWIVALKYTKLVDNTKTVFCAGTLINNRYVVTAAHCVDRYTLPAGWELSSVILGDWQLSTDPDCTPQHVCAAPALEVSPERVLVHPRYNKGYKYSNDIALIRLNQTISFTMFVQPMCLPPFVLPPSEVSIGMPVTALGWGQRERGATSDILQKVKLNITTPLLCLKTFPNYFRINRGQLCIGGTGGMDTCSGDSGGPLIKMTSGNNYILALTSLGPTTCGAESVPAIYTSVAHYAFWIRQALLP